MFLVLASIHIMNHLSCKQSKTFLDVGNLAVEPYTHLHSKNAIEEGIRSIKLSKVSFEHYSYCKDSNCRWLNHSAKGFIVASLGLLGGLYTFLLSSLSLVWS